MSHQSAVKPGLYPVGDPSQIPSAKVREVEEFVQFLGSQEGWITARALRDEKTKWNERKLRALAEASDGRIISGNAGYKLTSNATSDEISEFINRWQSQVDRMQARIDQVAGTPRPPQGLKPFREFCEQHIQKHYKDFAMESITFNTKGAEVHFRTKQGVLMQVQLTPKHFEKFVGTWS